MFEDDLDTPTKLLAHLDRRACWDQHKQERISRLHSIAERCLELHRKKRPELAELIPELEEVRRGTEALQALEAERAVGPLLEAEAAEKECCICLKAEEVSKLLALVPCGHRCVCAECSAPVSALVVGRTCPVCRTEARQAIRVFVDVPTNGVGRRWWFRITTNFIPHHCTFMFVTNSLVLFVWVWLVCHHREMQREKIYLQPNKKRRETRGLRCHVKTMMNMEACEPQDGHSSCAVRQMIYKNHHREMQRE
jgi:hypothetical protein